MCVLDPTGVVLEQSRVPHDVGGLIALSQALDGRDVAGIAIERGEGLLVEHVQARGHRLFCISPKMSARARERYRMAAAKSDAFVLADTLRQSTGTCGHWRGRRIFSPNCEL